MPKPRVLVVEDEPIIRELIVETLNDAGYQVEEAATADDGARLLEADGYRLLITDVHTPGELDGLNLAELARDHNPPVPVVVITGRPDVIRRVQYSGIHGSLLAKPFKLEELARVAARYVTADRS